LLFHQHLKKSNTLEKYREESGKRMIEAALRSCKDSKTKVLCYKGKRIDDRHLRSNSPPHHIPGYIPQSHFKPPTNLLTSISLVIITINIPKSPVLFFNASYLAS